MPLLKVGDAVGPYRVTSRLGDGGMGEVYRVVKRGPNGFQREFALKVMVPASRSQTPAYAAMFQSEARLGARFHHANLVPVLEHGVRTDGVMWLVQELVEGMDLGRVCRASALPVPLALFVLTELLRALRYLHQAPRFVVHEDVKPGNILIGFEGSVRLTDFGIAEAVGEGPRPPMAAKGSPAYMAPECVLDLAPPTPRSDLFGAGLVLCEMLAGRPLCGETDMRQAVYRGDLGSLARVGVRAPAHVEDLARWLLQCDPRLRCPSAEHALAYLGRMPEARAAGARELEALLASLEGNTALIVTAPTLRWPAC